MSSNKRLEYDDQWEAVCLLHGKPRSKTVGKVRRGETDFEQKHTEVSEWLVL